MVGDEREVEQRIEDRRPGVQAAPERLAVREQRLEPAHGDADERQPARILDRARARDLLGSVERARRLAARVEPDRARRLVADRRERGEPGARRDLREALVHPARGGHPEAAEGDEETRRRLRRVEVPVHRPVGRLEADEGRRAIGPSLTARPRVRAGALERDRPVERLGRLHHRQRVGAERHERAERAVEPRRADQREPAVEQRLARRGAHDRRPEPRAAAGGEQERGEEEPGVEAHGGRAAAAARPAYRTVKLASAFSNVGRSFWKYTRSGAS
ncbi:hypothetical protein AMYX_32750 [Anaeromyxobacter diazotrophicus]|uniref:Uncharacterized protein n=1 Tax=Anaeromyxobacter diazotrophicus TaxID=2590199 RepID=A0A7I9VQ50_9BACT|nr:hypothetical protein AMYX_32750 [Anaeromyxobacter diazotrophicus]